MTGAGGSTQPGRLDTWLVDRLARLCVVRAVGRTRGVKGWLRVLDPPQWITPKFPPSVCGDPLLQHSQGRGLPSGCSTALLGQDAEGAVVTGSRARQTGGTGCPVIGKMEGDGSDLVSSPSSHLSLLLVMQR